MSMKKKTKKHSSIAYGLFCAGALGLLAPAAVLAQESTTDNHVAQAQTSQDSDLSSEINRFNEQGGSLENRGAASGDMSDDTHAPAGAHSSPDHPKADELSNEIKQYNSNGGSRQDNTAAGSDTSGSADSTMSNGANASPNGGSNADTRELSNEIEDYNKNAH